MNAVDTNILIYACDRRDVAKQAKALSLLEFTSDLVMPWQVACEFIAAARKLAAQGLDERAAWTRMDEFMGVMPVVLPGRNCLAMARRFHLDHSIQFWDATLYAACVDAGVDVLFSEDVPAARLTGLRVINPFI